jgi:hypothetical protein
MKASVESATAWKKKKFTTKTLKGATTLRMTTFSRTTLSVMIFSRTTLSMMLFSITINKIYSE